MRSQLVMSDCMEGKVCDHEEWLYSFNLGARFSIDGGIHRDAIVNADLRGADFEAGIVDGVAFLRVNLQRVSFCRVWFEDVRFIDCDLRGAIFAGAEKLDVAFEGCLLEGADFGDHPMGGRIA